MIARRTARPVLGLAAAVLGATLHTESVAQAVYAYPMAGQPPEQQARDDGECRLWAQQMTGVNPNQPPPQVQGSYAAPPQQTGFFGARQTGSGGVVRDAAGGAALGALGGAIAGDAGKGAAIGAAAGALFGGVRRSSRRQQEADWQAQQQAQLQQQQQSLNQQYQQSMGAFTQAYGACMRGRQYQVN